MYSNVATKRGEACLLFGGLAGHMWPLQTAPSKWPLDEPFRRAKNGPSQMIRPGRIPLFLMLPLSVNTKDTQDWVYEAIESKVAALG